MESLSITAPGLSLPILIGYALVDSINPCVIGVLLVMCTVLLKMGNKKKLLFNGLAYVAGVYVTYIVGGLTLLSIFNAIRGITVISQYLYLFIGIFIMIAAFLEIKDFYWYGWGYSLAIPKKFISLVEGKMSSTAVSMGSAFVFGGLITLVELPCTGAPYLAILAIMSQGGMNFITGLPLLLLYNLVFIIPLIVIIGMIYYGFSIKVFEGWRQEHRGSMRLGIGIALLAVGIWIITAVFDKLTIPLIIGSLAIIAIMGFIKYVVGVGKNI
ncbi:MAG: hypothetical protein EXS49_01945 [Candidatus Pacebacteria bacterium]|nr:hypothetical protein [Candidatus Paceibacterota bacterium]